MDLDCVGTFIFLWWFHVGCILLGWFLSTKISLKSFREWRIRRAWKQLDPKYQRAFTALGMNPTTPPKEQLK